MQENLEEHLKFQVSLEKKGMVYDAYANDNVKYKMWCLTWDATEIVGVPSSWE